MILLLQIFDVIANENSRYKRNELEFIFAPKCSREFTKKLTQKLGPWDL